MKPKRTHDDILGEANETMVQKDVGSCRASQCTELVLERLSIVAGGGDFRRGVWRRRMMVGPVVAARVSWQVQARAREGSFGNTRQAALR